MKLFLCQPFETSDDDEEEEVSEEEEQQEESIDDEDESETGDTNTEDDLQVDSGDEIGAEEKPIIASSSETKAAHNGDSKNDSDASLSGDAEISLKNINGKLDINGGKPEELGKKIKSNTSKSPSNTKSNATTATVSARLKNVTTEMMVLAAIRSLNERGGSSTIAIKKYIMNNYPKLDGPRTLMLIKKFIKKALANGKLVQAKGTGLGGSFKVSAEMNRLEEQKKRQDQKKLLLKAKQDMATSKADKMSKASVKPTQKKTEKGAKKTITAKKTAKISMKGGDFPDPVKKVKTVVAKTKIVAKLTDKNEAKKTVSKETKATTADNKGSENSKTASQSQTTKPEPTTATNGTSGKTKRGALTKSAPTLALGEAPASPPRAVPKVKAEATPKRKPTTKGKAAAEVAEIGAGDADTMKTGKKPAAKKGKAK